MGTLFDRVSRLPEQWESRYSAIQKVERFCS